jgi:hypothetical protein
MTEGNGHQIDPVGEARRALQAAVAEYGPEALSNPVVMDGICRNRLAHLPGESILIGSAARSDVPALLRERVLALGVDSAIRSVAATLAAAHELNTPAAAWVVQEFAQALGYTAIPTVGMVPAGFTGQGDAFPPGPASRVPVRPPPSRRRGFGLNRNMIGVAVAAALVGAYLAVAATAHLTPFGPKPVSVNSPTPIHLGGSSPGRSPDAVADASPDVSPDPPPGSDPGATLLSLSRTISRTRVPAVTTARPMVPPRRSNAPACRVWPVVISTITCTRTPAP